MNRFFVIIVVFLFGFNSFVFSQKSEETITQNGKQYYVHIVKPGNSLYGLYRLYNVGVDDIKKANPSIGDDLKEGQRILIPAPAKIIPAKESKTVLHKVKAKETLYGISKQYNVSIESIRENNPFLSEGLKIGQELRIITQQEFQVVKNEGTTNAEKESLEENNTTYSDVVSSALNPNDEKTVTNSEFKPDSIIKHKVLKEETLFSISKRYMIPMKELYNYNEFSSKGISVGDVINVPIKLDNGKKVSYRKLPKLNEVRIDSTWKIEKKDYYKIVYMLPFFLDNKQNDYLDEKQLNFRTMVSGLATDFYMGSIIALDSLKRLGLNAEITFIDTKNDSLTLAKKLDSLSTASIDLIIGPLFPESVKQVADWCLQNKVKMVCPVSTDTKVLKGNPEVSISIASDYVLMEKSADYLVKRVLKTNEKLVLVKPKENSDILMYEHFRAYLLEVIKNKPIKLYETNLKEYKVYVQKGVKTLFVVPTTDENSSLSFISQLISTSTNSSNTITVFGTKEWLNFENMNGGYRNKFNFHFAAPNNFDFKNIKTIELARKYRLKYDTDLTKIAALGYDVTFSFCSEYFLSIENGYVLGDYIYKTKGEGNGYENNSVQLFYQKDYELHNVLNSDNE